MTIVQSVWSTTLFHLTRKAVNVKIVTLDVGTVSSTVQASAAIMYALFVILAATTNLLLQLLDLESALKITAQNNLTVLCYSEA